MPWTAAAELALEALVVGWALLQRGSRGETTRVRLAWACFDWSTAPLQRVREKVVAFGSW